MNNEQSKKISIQLSPENLFKLNTLSKQNRVDLSVIVNEALSAYLDQKKTNNIKTGSNSSFCSQHQRV
jgi:predicted DNA-binding protein